MICVKFTAFCDLRIRLAALRVLVLQTCVDLRRLCEVCFASLGSTDCFLERSYQVQTHTPAAVDTHFIEPFELGSLRSNTAKPPRVTRAEAAGKEKKTEEKKRREKTANLTIGGVNQHHKID